MCNGTGTYYFNNGDKTDGNFNKNKATGSHTRKCANGQLQTVIY